MPQSAGAVETVECPVGFCEGGIRIKMVYRCACVSTVPGFFDLTGDIGIRVLPERLRVIHIG